MIELPRRRFLAGLAGIIAARAIVRAASIMPVRPVEWPFEFSGFYSRIPTDQLQCFSRSIIWLSNSGVIRVEFSEACDPNSFEVIHA